MSPPPRAITSAEEFIEVFGMPPSDNQLEHDIRRMARALEEQDQPGIVRIEEPMHEDAWLNYHDTDRMLSWLGIPLPLNDYGPASYHHNASAASFTMSQRQARLYVCACCRRKEVWDELSPVGQVAVDLAEEYADIAVGRPGPTFEELIAAGIGLAEPPRVADYLALCCIHTHPFAGLRDLNLLQTNHVAPVDPFRHYLLHQIKAHILRDICGNPWRPVVNTTEIRTERAGQAHVKSHRGEVDFVTPEHITPTVLKIVDSIYDGAFYDLPILADALEEAGLRGRIVEAKIPDGEELCEKCNSDGFVEKNVLPKPRSKGSARDLSGRRVVKHVAPVKSTQPCLYCSGTGIVKKYKDGWVEKPHPLLEHLRSPGPHVKGCWAIDLLQIGRNKETSYREHDIIG